MAKPRSGSLLVALLTALVLATSPAAMANSDAPFMVAHKKVSLTRLKSGVERVSVSIDLYNQGSSTAYDVSLNDDNWSQDMFDLVSDGTSKTWERLDAGSSASHSFILESKAKGMFHGSPAVIKFRIPTKAAPQEAYSTPILPLDVLADKPPEKKFEWRLLAKYGSLVSVLTLVGLFIYVIATPSETSKKRRSEGRGSAVLAQCLSQGTATGCWPRLRGPKLAKVDPAGATTVRLPRLSTTQLSGNGRVRPSPGGLDQAFPAPAMGYSTA
ncbi:translocon-associated protein [Musa troglodytarum]|uniref:Translocon-associated protein n=1 Tax=Musa troglodytarum TaxID=320322 RepID=A0A9E7L3A7_9LILI|nr:translocon-associated protein [Musa troglodytarum]